MKNIIKFVFIILALCFIVFLISCCEAGGTIIIKNNYSEDKMVIIYEYSLIGVTFNYKDKYGPQNIVAGCTGSFSVKSNAVYGIIWTHNKIDYVKTAEVSYGETVEKEIP